MSILVRSFLASCPRFPSRTRSAIPLILLPPLRKDQVNSTYDIKKNRLQSSAGSGWWRHTQVLCILIRGERVDTRQFAEDIAEMNLLSTTVVYAVLEPFFKRSNHYLSKGQILDLSQFGTFLPYIGSKGMDTPEEVSPRTFKSFYVNYRPGKLQKRQMRNVEFQKVYNGITEEITA
ncbi:MAG: putative histone-like DNA-binding protein [Cyclobacteriaceae bacterium]|jgi:predicted histone-like DNA-binding protein